MFRQTIGVLEFNKAYDLECLFDATKNASKE